MNRPLSASDLEELEKMLIQIGEITSVSDDDIVEIPRMTGVEYQRKVEQYLRTRRRISEIRLLISLSSVPIGATNPNTSSTSHGMAVLDPRETEFT
jgi:hypothetical protein